MSKVLIWGAFGVLLVVLGGAGKTAIDTMGGLVHFNCRPQSNRVVCELTHEPLIGRLDTRQFDKAELQTTRTQQGRSSQVRLALMTRSGEEIPLTPNWSASNNQQLFRQREAIDRFLADPKATTLSVRTHRPGQLWVILAGLIGAAILAGGIAISR
jgi:hypothetical protein